MGPYAELWVMFVPYARLSVIVGGIGEDLQNFK